MKSGEELYIWQSKAWSNWVYDLKRLAPLLAQVHQAQGHLQGRMHDLGMDLRDQATLRVLTEDVLKTSEIEGEKLNPDSVRSSIARRLGVDIGALAPADRHVDGVVDMVLDATQRHTTPLTAERLYGWHAAMFPTGYSGLSKIRVGQWRDDAQGPMQVVSGPMHRQKVHYEAPPAHLLDAEMSDFMLWFNVDQQDDPVIKAGLAHLWFVTIHPFEDGNGRVSRAIADLALARADRSDLRFYSMSAQIETERSVYYAMLERTQKGGTDITGWLVWFLGCLGRALDRGEKSVAAIIRKASTWERINAGIPVNERQRAVIHALLDGPVGDISTSRYAKLAGCSLDTALRDLKALVEAGVLAPGESGGQSTRYRLSADPAAPGAEGPRG